MRKWTVNDDRKMLAALARGRTATQVGRTLGRSAQSVRARWRLLDSRPDLMRAARARRAWTADEVDALRTMYLRGDSLREISLAIARSRKSCSVKAAELGIRKNRRTRVVPRSGWSPEQDATAAEMFAASATDEDVAEAVGKTIRSARRRRKHLRTTGEIPHMSPADLRERDRQGKVWRALEVGVPIGVAADAVGYATIDEAADGARAYGRRVCGRTTPHRYDLEATGEMREAS